MSDESKTEKSLIEVAQALYARGYEVGYAGNDLKAWPTDVPREGMEATWLKAGWADGTWDHGMGYPHRHSFDPPKPKEVPDNGGETTK